MMKFFCEICGKPMWDSPESWERKKHLTLEDAKHMLVCSDCLLAEVRELPTEQPVYECALCRFCCLKHHLTKGCGLYPTYACPMCGGAVIAKDNLVIGEGEEVISIEDSSCNFEGVAV